MKALNFDELDTVFCQKLERNTSYAHNLKTLSGKVFKFTFKQKGTSAFI